MRNTYYSIFKITYKNSIDINLHTAPLYQMHLMAENNNNYINWLICSIKF